MIWQILISVILSSLGQVLVKLGASKLDINFSIDKIMYTFVNILKNVPLMVGIISYGVSFLIWIKVLSKVELSYAYPMVSLGYVIVLFFSYFLFKENITYLRIIGILFIIVGVIFVSRS
ncbi:EamA family transporter [Clostridium sp. MSJ-11]|uniref:EamA family transporter n=1 Tax=Clostridium mobile TaxID=2841512 RepID=A0ABS6EC95_9CLOT|nr:SMR family transporter [Clostridium mobile]MBU5482805.1 EamA family transporter [Clostridium mobile]